MKKYVHTHTHTLKKEGRSGAAYDADERELSQPRKVTCGMTALLCVPNAVQCRDRRRMVAARSPSWGAGWGFRVLRGQSFSLGKRRGPGGWWGWLPGEVMDPCH